MVRRELLLAGLIAVSLSVLQGAATAGATDCSQLQFSAGACQVHGSIGHGSVDVGGNAKTPGGPTSGAPEAGGTEPDDTDLPQPGDPNYIVHEAFGVIAPISIKQLRHFHPNPGTDHMQPNGWIVIGLSTNFYSAAGGQSLRGHLLGKPVAVRFTPVRWHWSYGDGTGAVTSTGGDSWQAQDILEFDPTPTSHIYAHRGTYYINLGVEFAAQYKFADGDWTPVDGTLTVPANRLKATAGNATTVLVGRDCTENPTGPGC